jgi:hypothetical protein
MQISDELREAVKRAMWTGGKHRTADRLAYEDRGPGADEVLTKLADDALSAALPLIRGAVVEECARVAADHGLITCDNDHDEGRVDASNDIAAAIRALKGGEA